VTQNMTLWWFTGTIKTNDTKQNLVNIDIYFNDKKIQSSSFSSTWSFLYNISNVGTYVFESFIWDTQLNTISLEYFSKTDIKKPISLIKLWNSYTWIIITNNVWWKKRFMSLTWTQILSNPIDITFEMIWSKFILPFENN
jgi:hypothetical protein